MGMRQETRKEGLNKEHVKDRLSLWVPGAQIDRGASEMLIAGAQKCFLNIIWNFLGIFSDYRHDRTGTKSNSSGSLKKEQYHVV